MRQTLRVTAISLAAFAVYLPVAYLAGRDFIPAPRPDGALVERLLFFYPVHRYAYQAQSVATWQYADLDLGDQKSPVIIYEDMKPLGAGHNRRVDVEDTGLGRYYHSKLANKTDNLRFFVFSTSDNSDPRTNGRTYWAVVPR